MYRKSRAQLMEPMTAKRFWEALKNAIPTKVNKDAYIYDDETGCKIIRTDFLAQRFQQGDPSFSYKERPECEAFKPSGRRR